LNAINAVVIDSKTETFTTAKTVIYAYKNKKFKKMNLVINVNNAKIFTYVAANWWYVIIVNKYIKSQQKIYFIVKNATNA